MPSSSSLYQFIRDSLSTSHPITKLVFLCFGMLSIWLIVSLFGALLAMPLFHLSWAEITGLINSNFEANDPGFMKYFQAVQSIGFFLVPGLILPIILFHDSGHQGSTNPSSVITKYTLILGTIICSVPIINFLVVWNMGIHLPDSLTNVEETLRQFEDKAAGLTEQLLGGTGTEHIIVVLFIAAVLPAIGEELIFRRILQTILHKWFGNIHLAIATTGIIFSAFHMQFFGFFPRLVLGIYFGYIYFWSRNIRFAIWAHFLNNALAIFILQMIQSENTWFIKHLGQETKFAVYIILAATMLTTALIFISRKIWINEKRTT